MQYIIYVWLIWHVLLVNKVHTASYSHVPTSEIIWNLTSYTNLGWNQGFFVAPGGLYTPKLFFQAALHGLIFYNFYKYNVVNPMGFTYCYLSFGDGCEKQQPMNYTQHGRHFSWPNIWWFCWASPIPSEPGASFAPKRMCFLGQLAAPNVHWTSQCLWEIRI